MIRTALFAAGALVVVALAVHSDYQWRHWQQQRREGVTLESDDPLLAAEVREALTIRKQQLEHRSGGR